MKEIFKTIDGYEGIYQISDTGRIKSLKFGKEKILNPIKNNRGYLQVGLCVNGKLKAYRIHRLVCETFLNNPENKRTVNHKNGIKTDNRLENLEFATHNENNKHAHDNGLNKGTWTGKFGTNHNRSIPICRYTKSGNYIDEFAGANEAYRKTGINQSSITMCCKGNKNYTHAGGYIWKYKNEKL